MNSQDQTRTADPVSPASPLRRSRMLSATAEPTRGAAGERAGLDEEFAVFVRTRQQSLLGFGYLITGQHQDAQDLVQAALVKAYLKWPKLHRDHNADAYVRKIMVNEHASIWRRAWRRRERSTGDLGRLEGHDDHGRVDHRSVDHGHVDHGLGWAEDTTWQRVLELPERQRLAIALRYYEDLSLAETAEILGCSVGTVKSQTSRAIATLRTTIGTDDLEVS